MTLRTVFILLLCLPLATAYPPVILQSVPNIQVNGGKPFQYTFNSSIFRSNKAGGTLNYALAGAIPSWLLFNASSRTVYGVAPVDQDVSLDLNLTATDRDGEASSGSFLFLSAVDCPEGLFRHFRVQLSSLAVVCTLLWGAQGPYFPSFASAAALGLIYNFTDSNGPGGPYSASYGPSRAFQQMQPDRVPVGRGWVQPCGAGMAWQVRVLSAHSRPMHHHII